MLEVNELIIITCSFCVHKSQDFAPLENCQHVEHVTVLLEAIHFGIITVSDSFTLKCCSRDKAQFIHPIPFNELG